MVVRSRGEHSCLFQPHLFYQLKIGLNSSDPSGNLWIFISFLQTFLYRFFVLVAIEKEFALPNHTLGTPQSMQHIVEVHYLLNCVRGSGLLAVPEGGAGYPYLIRQLHGYYHIVKDHPRHFRVGEDIPEQVGLLHIFNLVFGPLWSYKF